jgi:GT2 family glycosyltransferase
VGIAATTKTEAAASEKMAGVQGELEALSLEAACHYYHNYLNTFKIDSPLAISFINRVVGEPGNTLADPAATLLTQAIKSAVQLANFDPQVLGIGIQSGICPRADTIVKVIEATHVEPEAFELLRRSPFKYHSSEIRKICQEVLARHPMALRYADWLLQLDLYEGKPPSENLADFRCPKVLLALWRKRLFCHQATLGNDSGAWPLWEGLKEQVDDPITLSLAAEMYHRQGATEQALTLYRRAAALDPMQRPYALRLEALESPFRPAAGLLADKRVCIYLYSYNKAKVLGETLESLAGCAIGPARIKVLLNGCTDDSLTVVEKAKGLFPRNDLEIINLPVNIGAPAARNWLLALPATRESDYVAFLDDDVYLQPDWLAHLLTVAESDPRIGNVGCKVVFPGQYRLLQYLYRHVSIATPEAIRVSLPTPSLQYDTGLYDVVREARIVMGCQHLLRVAALADAPTFDIRYSPSQIDDTDHDLQLCLAGWKVFYCGTVTCVHRQNSGTSARSRLDMASQGSIAGNDVKFFYKWYDRMDALRALDSLGLTP